VQKRESPLLAEHKNYKTPHASELNRDLKGEKEYLKTLFTQREGLVCLLCTFLAEDILFKKH
jgi:hypothetical protein